MYIYCFIKKINIYLHCLHGSLIIVLLDNQPLLMSDSKNKVQKKVKFSYSLIRYSNVGKNLIQPLGKSEWKLLNTAYTSIFVESEFDSFDVKKF